MSYLRGAEAGAAVGTRAGDTVATAEGGATCPVAGGGATGGGVTIAIIVGSAAGGGAAAAGGEKGLTRGLKEELCPPQVSAMAELGVGEEEWRRKEFSQEKISSGNGLKRNRMEVRDIYRGSGKVKGL